MRSRHCPPGGHDLAPRRLTGIFVLLPPCAAVHIRDNDRRASLFPRGTQLRGHKLPEARVFTLYLLKVVPMSEESRTTITIDLVNLQARGTPQSR
jgi:hypothetical protein